MAAEQIILIAATLTALFSAALSGAGLSPASQLPVSYVCPMDGDILEDKPGACPICKMDLQPARIETAWACPIHAVTMKNEPGRCELDHRDLVPVTINHFWVCPDNAKVFATDPGKCADGQPRQERRVLRAHGDHNPRHGGQFFMAGDRWHHLEGTYPSAKVFRLYFYDNFTNPLSPKDVAGRVFTREEAGREIDPVQLTPSRDGTTLEARIAGNGLPQTITAKVRFKTTAPEQRFDFTFQEITTESAVALPPTPGRGVARTGASVRSGRTAAASAPSAGGSSPAVPVAPLAPDSSPNPMAIGSPWPGTISDALTVLDIRTREILTLIEQGNLVVVYAPTMLAKDLALDVVDHIDELPAERRNAMSLAVRRVVLAAWKLDRFGDLGDRPRLIEAHADFALAVGEMRVAYAER